MSKYSGIHRLMYNNERYSKSVKQNNLFGNTAVFFVKNRVTCPSRSCACSVFNISMLILKPFRCVFHSLICFLVIGKFTLICFRLWQWLWGQNVKERNEESSIVIDELIEKLKENHMIQWAFSNRQIYNNGKTFWSNGWVLPNRADLILIWHWNHAPD